MNRASLLIGIVVALSVVLGTGCLGDAPHDNSFDPDSDRFVKEGQVSGIVTDRTGAGLPDAEVRLLPGSGVSQSDMLTQTDSRGVYRFANVLEGDGYRLRVQREGYDERMVEAFDVQASVLKELPTLQLNALPVLLDASFRTIHISRWWPTNDLFFLEVSADVTDADGLIDIAQVQFEIPDLGFSVRLDPQAQPAGRYSKLIRADSLPTASLQSLLGRGLQINISDKAGIEVKSASRQLVRVLEETPIPTAPSGDVVLNDGRPTFTWEPFQPRFPFTYRIDIFRDEVNRVILARQINNIPMAETALLLGSALPPGPYFWTITVVDAFGNQSSSKEAAFRVP